MSLNSLSQLILHTPHAPQHSHLLSLLHQRISSLLQLKDHLADLSARRNHMVNLRDAYVGAVEDELLDVEGMKRLKGKGKARDLESDWIREYESTVDEFERKWSEDFRQFESWEILPSTSTSSSSCSTSTTDSNIKRLLPTFSLPTSWIHDLPDFSAQGESIHEFVKLLVMDPGMLGGSIATLEGNELSSLLLPLPSSSLTHSTPTNTSSPLAILLSLVTALRGPRSTLDFLVGIWETALREIVGREMYRKTGRSNERADLPGEKGRGSQDGRGSREKELEYFLVGVLEILDSIGLSLNCKEDGTLDEGGGKGGTGPFDLCSRPLESILLDFLHALSELPLPSPAPSSATPTSNSTSNPWSTITSTITGLPMQMVGLPMMGYDTLLSAGTGLSNVAMQGVGNLFPSPLSGNFSAATSTANTHSTIRPSNPTASRFLPSPPSSNALNQLLIRTATKILDLLTPRRSSSEMSIPITQGLLQHLLSSSGLGEAEKKKVQILALVRFWGFSWLGRKLGKLGAGGGYTYSVFEVGVHLTSADGGGGGGSGSRTSGISSSALLDEIYVGMKEKGHFAGLHKVIYDALVSEVHGGKLEEPINIGLRRTSEQKEKESLARAAKAFISSFVITPKESTTPRSDEAREQREVKVHHLGADEFRTLFESFGGLVVRRLASVPIPKIPTIPTFKRATSFKSESTTSSTPAVPPAINRAREESNRSHSFADSSLFSSSSSTTPSLAERLQEVIEDMSMMRSRMSGKALLVCSSRDLRPEDGLELQINGRMPDFELYTTSELNVESKRNTGETPGRKARVEDSEVGWISPPQSPRQEALGLGSGYSPNLIGIQVEVSREEEAEGEQLSEEERSILTRTVILLTKSGRISSTHAGPVDVFSHLSSRFFVEQFNQVVDAGSRYYHNSHEFASHVLCSQASNILHHYSSTQSSIYTSILSQLARPFEHTREISESVLRTAHNRISELDSEKSNLLNAARMERSALDNLRVRAWYSSLKLTENYRQLTLRLEEIAMPRTDSERKEGQKVLEAWSNELGVYSFMKSRNTSLEESLRLVEIFVTMSMDPKSFYASKFWRRESEVVQKLMASRSLTMGLGMGAAAKSFAEVLVAGGSSILTAPLTLAAMATTVVSPSTASQTSAAQPPVDLPLLSSPQSTIILSFGAASPSLLKPHEATTVFKSAIEEHLLRVTLKLSGLLWSDLTRAQISNRDSDYKLLGCDSWMAEFAGPLSPLKRDRSEEGKGKPLVFSTSGLSKTEDYFGVILERFARHPSPHAKLLALYELETVLTATISGPSYAKPVLIPSSSTSPPSSHSDNAHSSTSKPKEYLAKLTGLLNKRMSVAPSAIALLLEGEETDSILEADGDVHSSSRSRHRSPSIFSETSALAPSPSMRHNRLGSVTSMGSQDTLLQQHPVLLLASPSPLHAAPTPHHESSSHPPTTDDLLLSLEHILLHHPQQEIYQSLQIVSSLLPSKVLDTGPTGKAFWDFALAALARKREVVEGPKGIVERGLDALAEGEDGIEVARRLLKIAAREESEVAQQMLERLGNVDGGIGRRF